MAHSAVAVANKFIELGIKNRKPLTPLQILKLVYLCHGWSTVNLVDPILNEPIQAWLYGPVIPTLYHALKHHGSLPVTEKIKCKDEMFNTQEEALIKEIYKLYKDYSGIELSTITHEENSPWDKVWNNGNGKNKEIPTALIQDYYFSLID